MAKQYIKIRGANEHNLKNVTLNIPRNELAPSAIRRKHLRYGWTQVSNTCLIP